MSDQGAPEPGDGGWLLSAIPLQLNDGPTAACPPGGKTLLREEGSPRALPSLKLVADNRSNLVSSSVKCSPPSPPTLVSNHQPRFRVPRALGGKTAKTNCRVQGSSCWCFPQPVTGVFFTFSTSGENLFPLVPAENFAFISTLWNPTEDPSLISAGTFCFSGPF